MNKAVYNLSPTEALASLKTAAAGLDSKHVAQLQSRYGANTLPEEKGYSMLLIFFTQFKSALIYILLAAAAISFFLGDFVNMGVILAAVFINVVVGFIQEFRAQKALEKLRQVVTQHAIVKRNGHEQQIEASELVPGDIVVLRAGDKVPADIRLISANDVKVNEASLTGESFPVKKTDEALPSAVILAERINMVFMGTVVVTGSAKGVVAHIGSSTELGKIAALIKTTEQEETPLQKKLGRLAKVLGVLVLLLSGIIFVTGIILGYDVEEMFTIAVALAVAAIPEGLVVVVTVILAIGMQRILKQKALVRKLVAAETLGSITVICTDKTGTLTEGEMRIVRIITHNQELDSTKHTESGTAVAQPTASYFMALKIGVLASDAYIENPDEAIDHRTVIGMPTEKAIVLAASQAGIDLDKVRKENKRIDEIPFSSEYKFMATLNEDHQGHRTINCKGAPEKILNHTTRIDLDGKVVPMDKKKKDKLRREYEKLSGEGMRLLAFCYKQPAKGYTDLAHDTDVLKDMIFVGFAVIKDPLRDGAKEMIAKAQAAGIRPVMITGDHHLTAQAIAKELGLPHAAHNIIDGEAFEKLDEKALRERIVDISVYARVTPKDKLRIIDAWQQRGDVVAMTGDGVNDAPALKSADIGVALGSGTDVAKETADIVLLDNNFKTIVRAVEQGRIIYENIKKVILYLMSDGFTEMILIAVAVMLRWELPILAAQILWVNLISDGFPNIALTMEKGEKNIMLRKPVEKNKSILDTEIKVLIVIISTLSAILALLIFSYILDTTGDLARARTVTFAVVAVNSLLYVFSCRSPRQYIWQRQMFNNKYLIYAVVAGFGLQLMAMYLPFFQNIFQTVNLGITEWLIILSVGLIDIIAIEITKWFFIHKIKKQPDQAIAST